MKYLNCFISTGLAAFFLVNSTSVLAADCSSDLTSGISTKRIYYVAPNGNSSNNGSSFNAPMSFSAAMAAVNPGELILLKPGTYTIPYTQGKGNTITFNKSGKDGARFMWPPPIAAGRYLTSHSLIANGYRRLMGFM
nr:hypothetical protein [Dickeya dadantii]